MSGQCPVRCLCLSVRPSERPSLTRHGRSASRCSRRRPEVADILERFQADGDPGTFIEELGVPRAELEYVVRVASRRAA